MSVVPLNKLKYRQKRPYSCGARRTVMDCNVDGEGSAAQCRTFHCNLESASRLSALSTARIQGIEETREIVMTIPAAKDKRFSRSPGGAFHLLFCSVKSTRASYLI